MFRWILAITLSVALVGVSGWSGRQDARAGADNPEAEATVEQLLSNLSDGDAAAAASLVADDLLLTEITELSGSFAIVGKLAFGFAIDDVVAANTDVTVLDIRSDGQVVTGVYEWSDDSTSAAGVDDYREFFTIHVNSAGLITRIQLAYDEVDSDTRQYLAYLDAKEEEESEDEGAPEDFIEVTLTAAEGDDQAGAAFLFGFEDGITGVGIEIAPFPKNGTQPASIRSGTCAAPGAIVKTLAASFNGGSFTILSGDLSELTGDLVVVVQESESNTDVAACGAVLGAVAPAPAPVAPAPAQRPPGAIAAPDTGTGGANGKGLPAWLYALTVTGAALALAGAMIKVRSR